MSQLYCIGVYESRSADCFPFHAAPILAERDARGGWRRRRYSISRPYRLVPLESTEGFRPLADLSVTKGDYVVVPPVAISPRSQVLVVAPNAIAVLTGPTALADGLWRGWKACAEDRIGYVRRSGQSIFNTLHAFTRPAPRRPTSPAEQGCRRFRLSMMPRLGTRLFRRVWDTTVWDTTVWDTTVWDTTVWDKTVWDTTVWDTTVWEAAVWDARADRR